MAIKPAFIMTDDLQKNVHIVYDVLWKSLHTVGSCIKKMKFYSVSFMYILFMYDVMAYNQLELAILVNFRKCCTLQLFQFCAQNDLSAILIVSRTG